MCIKSCVCSLYFYKKPASQGNTHINPILSFCCQFICSYVLRPVAFILGVEWKDCDVVAELLGIKTFLNEFVAYAKLSEYITNREQANGLRTISVSTTLSDMYCY